jgi:hypothetical protein
LYVSPNIFRIIKSRMRWAGYVAPIGEMRNPYIILVEKSDGKRSLGRPRRRWKCNIRMDVREIRWAVLDRIHVAQYSDQWQALMNMVIYPRVPLGGGGIS